MSSPSNATNATKWMSYLAEGLLAEEEVQPANPFFWCTGQQPVEQLDCRQVHLSFSFPVLVFLLPEKQLRYTACCWDGAETLPSPAPLVLRLHIRLAQQSLWLPQPCLRAYGHWKGRANSLVWKGSTSHKNTGSLCCWISCRSHRSHDGPQN